MESVLKRLAYAAAVIALMSSPAMATGKPPAGTGTSADASATAVGVGVGEGGSGGTGGDSKIDGLAIGYSAPSFSYAPGAAAGADVVTTSYSVGFPVIGGGVGEQTIELTPDGIRKMAGIIRDAKSDSDLMAVACTNPVAAAALDNLNIDCATKPVGY